MCKFIIKMRGRTAKLLAAMRQIESAEMAKTDRSSPPVIENGRSLELRKRRPLEDLLGSNNVTSSHRDSPRNESGLTSVVVNYLKVQVDCEPLLIYQYNVVFKPECERRSVKTTLIKQIVGEASISAYDGRSILYICNCELQRTEGSLRDSNGNHVSCKVSLVKKMVNEVPCVVLNTLFRQIMSDLRYVLQKRTYFDMKASILMRQSRLEVWPGIATSCSYFKTKDKHGRDDTHLLVCLDVCHRVVRTITCYQMYEEMVACSRTNDDNLKKQFKKDLIGSVVLTRYNNKTYRVDDVLFDETSSSGFKDHSGNFVTYEDYYKKTYDLQIANLDQPLILSRIRQRGPTQGPDRYVKLIPEFCYLTGLTDSLRADFKAMKDLSSVVHLDPTQRMDKLCKYVDNVMACREARSRLEQWHLKLDTEFLKVRGNMLASETLNLANGGSFRVGHTAEWNRELSRMKVAKTASPSQWMIVCPRKFERLCYFFKETAMRECITIGMSRLPDPIIALIKDDRSHTYIEALNDCARNNHRIDLSICIVPDQREERYAAIKTTCCVAYPMANQVILTRSLSNANKARTIIQRILMQLVCKLGGHLWSINIPLQGLMVIGVDVYHHGASRSSSTLSLDLSSSRSSVVGVVASVDSKCNQWFSRASMHPSNRQEIADGLRICFVDCLRHYHAATGNLPSKVVIYRDSAGDSQFQVIIEHEVKQFENATYAFGESYKPDLVTIAVNKRIQSRIFSLDKHQKLQNPSPGCIVDTDVARFAEKEFLLVSQLTRQGSVSPTRYVVLVNTYNPLTLERLQKLTFKLTHVYYNWPGTIAIPAPCLYAHKLAYLVGQYVRREPDLSLADKLFYL
ncbi:hypothetical protein ACOME3_000595 [Neoechinorhynchus agilis]